MSNLPANLQPPPIKTPFDDFSQIPDESPGWFQKWASSVKVSHPWLKWFQQLATYLNAPILYTPAITAGSGAFTTVSAAGRYRQIGKLIFFQITITITTNGTAAGYVQASLPFTSLNASGVGHVCVGRAADISGKILQGLIQPNSNQMLILNYDNSYPGASGETLLLSGFYEVA